MYFSRSVFVVALASGALARPQGWFSTNPPWNPPQAQTESPAQDSNNGQQEEVGVSAGFGLDGEISWEEPEQSPDNDNGWTDGWDFGWPSWNPWGKPSPSSVPTAPSTQTPETTKEIFTSLPSISSLPTSPSPINTNFEDNLLPTGTSTSQGAALSTGSATIECGPEYSDLSSAFDKLFPTGNTLASTFLSDMCSPAASTPTTTAALSDLKELSSILQQTATSLPSEVTKISSILSVISSKNVESTSLPSGPAESLVSSDVSGVPTSEPTSILSSIESQVTDGGKAMPTLDSSYLSSLATKYPSGIPSISSNVTQSLAAVTSLLPETLTTETAQVPTPVISNSSLVVPLPTANFTLLTSSITRNISGSPTVVPIVIPSNLTEGERHIDMPQKPSSSQSGFSSLISAAPTIANNTLVPAAENTTLIAGLPSASLSEPSASSVISSVLSQASQAASLTNSTSSVNASLTPSVGLQPTGAISSALSAGNSSIASIVSSQNATLQTPTFTQVQQTVSPSLYPSLNVTSTRIANSTGKHQHHSKKPKYYKSSSMQLTATASMGASVNITLPVPTASVLFPASKNGTSSVNITLPVPTASIPKNGTSSANVTPSIPASLKPTPTASKNITSIDLTTGLPTSVPTTVPSKPALHRLPAVEIETPLNFNDGSIYNASNPNISEPSRRAAAQAINAALPFEIQEQFNSGEITYYDPGSGPYFYVSVSHKRFMRIVQVRRSNNSYVSSVDNTTHHLEFDSSKALSNVSEFNSEALLPAATKARVHSGDTLQQIADDYEVSLPAILRANPDLQDPDSIYAGDEINIPAQGYTVQAGDSFSSIAKKFSIPVSALELLNPEVDDPDYITPSDVLKVPASDLTEPFVYTVRARDTLWKIARKLRIPYQELVDANPQISNPGRIDAGLTVKTSVYLPSQGQWTGKET